jgi:hypothetical protein
MQVAPPDLDRMFGALAGHTRRDIVRRAITPTRASANSPATTP